MGFIGGLLRVVGVVTGLVEISNRVAAVSRRRRAGAAPVAVYGGFDAREGSAQGGAMHGAADREEAMLEIERARFEAERRHEEETLRLERLRQAVTRKGGEIRLVAWIAVAGWLGSALLALRSGSAAGSGTLLGIGWTVLLAALACVFAAQARLALEHAARLDDDGARPASGGGAAVAARWLLVAGLALTGAGVLLRLG